MVRKRILIYVLLLPLSQTSQGRFDRILRTVHRPYSQCYRFPVQNDTEPGGLGLNFESTHNR